MNVPLLDLKRTYETIETEVTAAVTELLKSQQMVLGAAVARFEADLASLCGVKHAVGCASGTDALLLALMALDIKPGDEVITTPFTFFATAGSIVRVGARPVFVDIDPDTFNIDASRIADACTTRTKAIMPVHLYGQSADMDPILKVALDRGLAVVEDAAQAIGATYKGRCCGAMGDIGCLSFYPTKNLGASGDAGALLTEDDAIAAELRSLRVHGTVPGDAYRHRRVGINSRLDALQAVILHVKMRHLAAWNAERRRLADEYTRLLAGVSEVAPPVTAAGCQHVYHQYVVRAARRDALMQYLDAHGVAARVFYPLALHMQECFSNLGYGEGDFPEAERACREVLALPIYPGLTQEEQEYVASTIRAFYAGK